MAINKDRLAATLFSLSTKQKAGNLKLDDRPLQYGDQQTYLRSLLTRDSPGSHKWRKPRPKLEENLS